MAIFTLKRLALFPTTLALSLLALAVSRAGDSSEVSRLKQALQNPADQPRIEAINALKIGADDAPKLAELLVPLLDDKNGEVQNRAREALVRIGPAALPALVNDLKSDAGRRRWPAAVGILQRIEAQSKQELRDWIPALATHLTDKDVAVRIESCSLLQLVAPRCKDSIPALVVLVSDPEGHLRNLSTNVLLALGADAVTALKDQLKNPRPEKRVAAIQALGRFDKHRDDISPALLALLKDDDVSVRIHVINALHPKRTPEYFDPIVAALADPNLQVRQHVVNYLQAAGKDAKPALKEVVKTLRDPDGHMRGQSQNILRNIGPDSLPELANAVTGNDLQGQIAALEVAQSIGKLPADVIPTLMKQSLGENPHLRNLAINALAKHIPETLPRFKELLGSKNPQDRLAALAGLQAAGPSAAAALPEVLVALKDPDQNMQNQAAAALMHLGPTVVPEVVTLLKNGDTRDLATRILDNMAGDLNALVEPLAAGGRAGEPNSVRALRRCGPLGQLALAELTKEKNPEIRVAALETLIQMGAPHPTIVADMIALLKDPNPKVRGAAYGLYARIHHVDTTTFDRMINALGDTSWEARRAASEVLVRHGPVPKLIDVVKKSPNSVAREEAIVILGTLGARAKPAIDPMLEATVGEPGEIRLRKRAFAALGKIEPNPRALLLTLLDIGESGIRVEAMQSLKREDVEASKTALIKLLGDKSAEVRSAAAKTLGQLGPGVLRDIEPLLLSQEPEVRAAAIQAIARHETPPLLAKYLGDDNIAVREAATAAIARHGSDAFPALEEAIRSKNFRVVRAAAQSLLLMEERPDDLVPLLTKTLLSKETEEPEALARAILAINPLYGARCLGASATTPVIIGLAKRDAPELQELACLTLAENGTNAADAADVLLALVKNPTTNANVLAAAGRALSAAGNTEFTGKIAPEFAERIVRGTYEKSDLLREKTMSDFLEGEANSDSLDAILAACALDQSTAEASEWAVMHANSGSTMGPLSPSLARILAKSDGSDKRFPGRLAPLARQALKAHFWRFLRDGAENNRRGIDARPMPNVKAPLPIENLLWMTSAYVALDSLKDDPEYRSDTIQGQTLADHHREWTQWWREWARERVQFGLWSDGSLENNQLLAWACLLNVYDCTSDSALKGDFKALLDLTAIEHEQSCLQGVRVGRYGKKAGVGSALDSLASLLLGQSSRCAESAAPNRAVFWTTSYRMPPAAVLLRMLDRPDSPYAATARRLGGDTAITHAGAHFVLGFQHPQPQGNPETLGVWLRLLFDDGNAIFFPHSDGDRHNVLHKNLYFSTCGSAERAALEVTASLNLVERDDWLFLSNGPAYAAIHLTGGYRLDKTDEKSLGRHRTHSVYPKTPQAVALMLAGDARAHGNFDAFQAAVLKSPLKSTPHSLAFTGPNLPAIEYFRDGRPPVVGGMPAPIRNDGKTFDSPYLQSDGTDAVVTTRFGPFSTTYDLRKK